jgi:hypothetical protein
MTALGLKKKKEGMEAIEAKILLRSRVNGLLK